MLRTPQQNHEKKCLPKHQINEIKNLPLPADLARIQYMSTMAHHHAAYVSSPDNSTVPPDSP